MLQQHKVQVTKLVLANPSRQLSLAYPVINNEAFKATINNYKAYVHHYNINIMPNINKSIETYNLLIEAHNNARNNTGELVKQHVKAFTSQTRANYGRGTICTRDYNELIHEHNHENPVKIPKKKHHKVKFATQEVFANLLGHAGYKLKMRNLNLMQLKENTKLVPKDGFKLSITKIAFYSLFSLNF